MARFWGGSPPPQNGAIRKHFPKIFWHFAPEPRPKPLARDQARGEVRPRTPLPPPALRGGGRFLTPKAVCPPPADCRATGPTPPKHADGQEVKYRFPCKSPQRQPGPQPVHCRPAARQEVGVVPERGQRSGDAGPPGFPVAPSDGIAGEIGGVIVRWKKCTQSKK